MVSYEHEKMESMRSFAHAVKDELDEKDYDEFLKLMRAFTQNRIARPETLVRLADLFKGHDNLVLGLNNFLKPQSIDSDHQDIDTDDDGDASFAVKLGKAITLAEKMRSFDSFNQALNKRLKSEVNLPVFYTHIESVFDKNPDLKADFIEFCEADESALIRISPSYLFLQPGVKGNNNILGTKDDDVLNDVCACRRLIESDGDAMRYEEEGDDPMTEHKNDREDDMFQVDMMFHTLKSTAAVFQKYYGLLINDYLKPMHYGCIENLYGDYGLDMTNRLQCDPERVSPVLLKRLNQKLDEMRSCYPWFELVIDDSCLWSYST